MHSWRQRLLDRHSRFSPLPSSCYKSLQTASSLFLDAEPTSTSSTSSNSPSSHLPSSISSLLFSAQSLFAATQIHTNLIKSGILFSIHTIRHHLISLYSYCRLPSSAFKLFDEIPQPGVVSWSFLISAYTRNGQWRESLLSFSKMRSSGVGCNEFTLPSVLKACSALSDFTASSQIHAIAVLAGFESDPFVANTLIMFYADFGKIFDCQKLFDAINGRNVVSWNALFSAYVKNDQHNIAVEFFRDMVATGMRPNEYGFSIVLNACTGSYDLDRGRIVHGYLIRLAYESDRFTANALLDFYAKLGDIDSASLVFEEISQPDIVSWNAFISGCVLQGKDILAMNLFNQMKESAMLPNEFTLSSILKASAGTTMLDLGQQIHAFMIKSGNDSDIFIGVGLVDLYAKCEHNGDSLKAFNLMQVHDLVAWNAIISGYSHNNNDSEALSLFSSMRKDGFGFNRTTLASVLKSVANSQASTACKQTHTLAIKAGFLLDQHVANGLVDAYGKCGSLEDAGKAFHECPSGDIVSFTSMITALSQSGEGEEAMKLFHAMREMDLKPDSFVCSSLLNSCANLSASEQGKQIHTHVVKMGFVLDNFASNALVNMYAKCGSIEDATSAFSEIPERGIVSWSAMIGGLAQHGHGKKALDYFYGMLNEGVPPNHITLTSVLCACNYGGLVTEAEKYFNSMEEMFGIERTLEHYACMVDILGRAGRLRSAMELVESMPFEANAAIWGALLGASRVHNNVEIGMKAAEMLLILEPEKSGTHVILANIYASAGMWNEVAGMRKLMRETMVKKEPGVSWIEVKDKVHTFFVGDRSHERREEIYAKLEELGDLMNKAGYVPLVETDLHYVEKWEKETLLLQHSEKLAVAFGLISTPASAPIRIMKNLRVCRDCHEAFKFICKITERKIILRDINRFHHFQEGACSCGDYW
ncbi:pentatricopeptide repeat-containing protein At5g04780-like [Phalaenopsis equestris]|uniref:pentatricopeptide repeat-containing protein At5g04780-like n=1 Tax=Phalaenopsis equestris TaxID=78828 RepID=UPI0009E363E9|nr:pentatricopeptide repeat-containing protein At5g04780-like [Phalaenopsis equestris]